MPELPLPPPESAVPTAFQPFLDSCFPAPGVCYQIEPLGGGKNNRGYRLTVVDSAAPQRNQHYFLKWYYQNPQDSRHRLHAEWDFIAYAHALGLDSTPHPVACTTHGTSPALALYEFIPGQTWTSTNPLPPPGQQHIAQAAAFLAALNPPGRHQLALGLSPASEAGFSVENHLAGLQRRLQRLAAIVPEPPADGATDPKQAELYAEARLQVTAIAEAFKHLDHQLLNTLPPLTPAQHAVSPSDFGFHNALLGPGDKVRFIDFEYAGWDDPAKMICDFFLQPRIRIPMEYWDEWTRTVLAGFPEPERLERRAHALFPLFRLRWACILLNEFLPTDAHRRHFSRSTPPTLAQKRSQIEKTRSLLSEAHRDMR